MARLIRFIILALALTATLAGPAEAGPLVAAITGIASALGFGTAAASAIATFFVKTIAAAGLSRLSLLFRSKQREPGITTETTTAGGTTPQKFILGLYASGGQLIAPINSYGEVDKTPRAYLVYPIVLSVVAGCTLERIIINDAYVPLSATSGAWGRAATGELSDVAMVDFRDGTQTTVHADLLAAFASDPDRPWLSDMVGPGTCYAVARFKYNRELLNGLPSVRFEVMGIPLYDPRADSTVGGSGAQRWANPATWAQTSNPMVMIYNILRGIDVGGGDVWGGECEAEDLPLSDWFAAMNECDLQVAKPGGGTEPQFRAGVEIALDNEPASVIEELLKTCMGALVEIGGIWKPRVGGPAMPSYFLTDDTIMISEDQEHTPFPSLTDTYNGITATYPDPASLWEPKEAPPRYSATWEAEDGGRRLVADLSLPACPYRAQVQRLQKGYVGDHRRMRRHQFVLEPDAALLEPLESVGYTSVRFGYTAKVFEITSMTDRLTTMRQGLTIRERDSEDVDFPVESYEPMDLPSPSISPMAPQVVQGWGITYEDILDNNGNPRRLGARMTWMPEGAEDARGLKWQIRIVGQTTVQLAGTHSDVTSGSKLVSEGLLSVHNYEGRSRYLVDRPTQWTGWTPFTTGDRRLGTADLADAVNTQISDATALVAEYDALVAATGGDIAAAIAAADKLASAGLEGWVKDAAFRGWSGTPVNLTATNWSDRSGTSAYAVMGGGDFGGGLHVTAPSGSALVEVIADTTTGLINANATTDYVVLTLHVDYLAGNPDGSAARVEWSNDGITWTKGDALGVAQNVGLFSALGLLVNPGVRQGVQTLWKRPAGVSGKIRMRMIPKLSTVTDAQEMIVHLLNLGPATQAQIDAGKAYTLATATPGVTVTVAGIGAAMAQLNTAMTARVEGNEASISTVSTAVADTNTAVASVQQTLEVTNSAAIFHDIFDNDLSGWEVLSGTGEVANPLNTSGVGSHVLTLGNNSGDDNVWLAHKHLIPFDPNKLYKLSVRARQYVGTGTTYFGFLGIASDGVTKVNISGLDYSSSQYYCATSNTLIPGANTDYVGYVKGRAATGVSGVGTLANPSEVHTDVCYLRPYIIANYTAAAGQLVVAQVMVEDGGVDEINASVTTHASAIADLEGNAAAMWGVKVTAGTGAGKLEIVAADNPTGPVVTTNLETDNLLIRASNIVITPGNMVSNPVFAGGLASGWREWNNTALQDVVVRATAGVPANAPAEYVMRYQFNAVSQTISTFNGDKAYSDADSDRAMMPIKAGEQYRVTIQAAANSATALTSFAVRVYWRLADGTWTTSSLAINLANLTTAWAEYTGKVTAPATAIGGWAYVTCISSASVATGKVYWTNLHIDRMIGAEFVINGLLITTAAQIGSAIIDTAHIADLAVDTLQIAGNAVTVPSSATASTIITLTTSFQTILTSTITRAGSRTAITLTAQIDGLGSALIEFQFLRGTTVLNTYYGITGSQGVQTTSTIVHVDQDTGSGSTTYTIKARYVSVGGYTYAGRVIDRTMILDHIKK